MDLGLDDVPHVTKYGTKEDGKIEALVISHPISNPEKRLSEENALQSPNVSIAADLRMPSGS